MVWRRGEAAEEVSFVVVGAAEAEAAEAEEAEAAEDEEGEEDDDDGEDEEEGCAAAKEGRLLARRQESAGMGVSCFRWWRWWWRRRMKGLRKEGKGKEILRAKRRKERKEERK